MQLKLRPTGRLNVQVRHFREGDGKRISNWLFPSSYSQLSNIYCRDPEPSGQRNIRHARWQKLCCSLSEDFDIGK
jgi:hypothetical protein